MADPLMTYEIEPPDNVIEASVSNDPDDINVVSIRIKATLKSGTSLDDLQSIRFTVQSDLTTNPASITPQAKSFDAWEMQPEGGDVFVATPRVVSSSLSGPAEWVFFLRDVEVVDEIGDTNIQITEVMKSGEERPVLDPEPRKLKIRKVHPSLRIDYFRVQDDEGNPIDASTTSGRGVKLVWTTTAASVVSLFGPGISGVSTANERITDDDQWPINPRTTSVYTLVATNGDAHAVAQVTVTVTDQVEVPKLVSKGAVEAASIVSTGAVEATGRVRAASIVSTGGVQDRNGPVVPAGLVAMWSGEITAIPLGWNLCDGTKGTPNLSGRFVIGYRKDDPKFGAVRLTGGEESVILTPNQTPLPSHTHVLDTDPEDIGRHYHTADGVSLGPLHEFNFGAWGVKENGHLVTGTPGTSTGSTGVHQHTIERASRDAEEAHPNLPPYFVLAYIMKAAT